MIPRALTPLAAAALTVALPLTACAQSSVPGLPGSGSENGITTDSLGSLAPERPLGPGPEIAVEVLADGLAIPWDVVRAQDGTILTGERGSGRLVAISDDGDISEVEADFGELAAVRESGLMGLALAPDFQTSRELYTCYSSATHSDNRVSAWRVAEDWSALEQERSLIDSIPLNDNGQHSGCRLLAHPDGSLYIGTGDAFTGPGPQDLNSTAGKILHISTENGEPASSSFDDSPVLTYGHRNVQGLAIRPGTDQILAAEHGPTLDDELNLLIPGANYGWNPDSSGRYDQNVPMTDTASFPDAIPASWRSGAPTLAPGGLAFLDHPSWGDWNGAAVVTMLKTEQIVLMRLSADGRSVTDTATMLRGEHGRLRSVTAAPDGSLFVTTSNGDDDKVLRIRPLTD